MVDDNETFARVLKKGLDALGLIVSISSNGDEAKKLLATQKFDAVISDIQMPKMNGIELMSYVHKQGPTPVILMTGFHDLAETIEAHQSGATYFISKPFKREDLVKILDRALSLKSAEDPQDHLSEESLCRIGIDTFVSGKEIKYDIFIKLNQAKFLKVAHKGENIPLDRITSYKNKGLHFLYIKRADFKRYIDLNLRLAQALTQSTKIERTKKINFMLNASQFVLEQIHLEGINEHTFPNVETMVQATMAVSCDAHDLISLFKIIKGQGRSMYTHGLTVCLHSIVMAKAVGWQSSQVIYKVALGAVLHDVGKKGMPQDIVEKDESELTSDERAILERHTTLGAESLNQVPNIPMDVVHIVAQHHENLRGTGYPAKLKSNMIHPLAKLVSVANVFCNLALHEKNSKSNFNPSEAVQQLCFNHKDTLDPTFIVALAEFYKVSLPLSYREFVKRRKAFST